MDSDLVCIVDTTVKYVATSDSAPPPSRPIYMKPAFQISVLLFWIAGIVLGILYDIGVFAVGEETVAEIIEIENLCQRYTTIVEDCTQVPTNLVTLNGCPTYYESDGSVCGTSADKISCLVNLDCTSNINEVQFNPLDAMCKGYSTIVNLCSELTAEEIAQNTCLIYYQPDGGVCVTDGDSCKANYKRCDIPV